MDLEHLNYMREQDAARRRDDAIRGFIFHLVPYLVVNAGLIGLDYSTGGGWWVHWVVLGWGIGILAHGLAVYFVART